MKRSAELDVLRFFAIALVLGRHMVPCPVKLNAFFAYAVAFWTQVGWVGVDLFFVLSGFLISGLLFRDHQKTGKVHVGRFYVRRGFNIYPAFWLLMAVTVAVIFHYYFKATERIGADAKELYLGKFWPWLWPNLAFVQNYFVHPESNRIWSIRMTWSLAVEEHFYLTLPLLLWALARWRKNFNWLPKVFASVAVACIVLRVLAALKGKFTTEANLIPTHLRMDSLMFGVLLSWWRHYHGESFLAVARHRGWLVFVGLLCLSFLVCFELSQNAFVYTYGYALIYVGCGAILVGVTGSRLGAGPLGRPMALIGTRSYSIYLWHVPAAWIATKTFSAHASFADWRWWAATYLVLAVVLGFAAAALVENPMLRLRDRLFPDLSRKR